MIWRGGMISFFPGFGRGLRVLLLVAWLAFSLPSVACAHTVVVGIGYSIPPYVLMDQDAGLEVDVIREAFSRAGYNARFRYLPNLRLPVVFASGEVDCVVTNSAYDLSRDTGIQPCYSDETLVFQNYAITLAEKGFHIHSIKDLADMRVLAFSNARGYLSHEFAVMAANNPQYQEKADQSLQVRMLYSDRVDVVISDERVFQYWKQHMGTLPLAGGRKLQRKVDLHPIFEPTPRHLAFRGCELCDAFNKGLKSLRESDTFEMLVARYTGIGPGANL